MEPIILVHRVQIAKSVLGTERRYCHREKTVRRSREAGGRSGRGAEILRRGFNQWLNGHLDVYYLFKFEFI